MGGGEREDSDPPVGGEDSSRLAAGMLSEARAEWSHADSKASLLLAGLGLTLGAVLAGLIGGDWSPTDLNALGAASWWLACVAALGAITFAGAAVWPRIGTPPDDGEIRFWGHVAELDNPDELTARLARSTQTVADRTAEQLWQVSRVMASKYRNLRVALGCAAASIALMCVAGLTTL